LRAYQEVLPEICQRNAKLVAITPELPDHSLSMVEKQKLEFPVLSDVGNLVARQYRLVFRLPLRLRLLYKLAGKIDLRRFNGDDSWTLPMPGTFVIARDGIVRAAFVNADYTLRMEPAAVLEALEGIHESST